MKVTWRTQKRRGERKWVYFFSSWCCGIDFILKKFLRSAIARATKWFNKLTFKETRCFFIFCATASMRHAFCVRGCVQRGRSRILHQFDTERKKFWSFQKSLWILKKCLSSITIFQKIVYFVFSLWHSNFCEWRDYNQFIG